MISIPQVEKGQGDVIGYKEDDGAWISAFFYLFTALHIVVAVLFHSWPVPDPWQRLGRLRALRILRNGTDPWLDYTLQFA